MSATPRPRRWRWLVYGIAVLVVLVVGGPFVYIHFIEGAAPASFTLSGSSGGTGSNTIVPLAGTWSTANGSEVGYRVKEVLFGQNNTAVGRTHAVTGTLSITGTTVESASFTVAMTTVTSNESQRDGQFRGRIMDVAKYPTATFSLTKPIPITTPPASGVIRSYPANGNLTLRGVTRPVTFTLNARHLGATIEVQGSVPILFADWKVPNPSFGPVSTQNHGILEFLLDFRHGVAVPVVTTTPPSQTSLLRAFNACMAAHGVTQGPRPGGGSGAPGGGGGPSAGGGAPGGGGGAPGGGGGPSAGGGAGGGAPGRRPGGGRPAPNPKTQAALKACSSLLPPGFGPLQPPKGPLPTIPAFSL